MKGTPMTVLLRTVRLRVLLIATTGYALTLVALVAADNGATLDRRLAATLMRHGFTGRIESTLERRLGRRVNHQLADLGRLLWFDTVTGLNNDNNCSGCHSPTNGFGDTQSIAIGVDNNGLVGPNRAGPRNQRRTPMILNSAFFPNLMWNSRFASLSNDPFDNSAGLSFPAPEGLTLSYLPHLLVAQAFIPPTERVEVAGFDFPGDNFDIRDEVLRRINDVPDYRRRFGRFFRSVQEGGSIDFDMFGSAIAEFEFQLTFADAPIDQFARGHKNALTEDQKRGALLFFGKARCVQCHTVSGPSNEMFSDFSPHVIGVPQVAPLVSNMTFDTSFAPRPSATWRSSRRSFTMARSRNSRMPCGITWMSSRQRETTTLAALVSILTLLPHRDPSSPFSRGSIPFWRHRLTWRMQSSTSSSTSFVTDCWIKERGLTSYAS
jgi:cytochrome c peroxidase